jgi:AraC-like DNA-binding protein
MTAEVSDAGASRTEFSTTDVDVIIDHLQNAYRTGMRISGPREKRTFANARLDGGMLMLDQWQLPLDLHVQQDPLNSLVVVKLNAGRIERACAGADERFLPGDVFVDAEPTLPATLRLLEVDGQTVMLDLAVLAQVAATSPTRAPGPIRFTGYRPVSPAAAQHWRYTVDYLGEVLANAEAVVQPLIRGNAAQLLAATVLTTFPNTAVTDPTAHDRHDATTATTQRATVFIEQHAHADISLADIAAAANVSIRTVQLAFRRHLDTTPMAYLRAVRLDRAHHELLTADPSHGATITAIAHRWGFYNQSRFAARYRHTYGLNPRHTLRT